MLPVSFVLQKKLSTGSNRRVHFVGISPSDDDAETSVTRDGDGHWMSTAFDDTVVRPSKLQRRATPAVIQRPIIVRQSIDVSNLLKGFHTFSDGRGYITGILIFVLHETKMTNLFFCPDPRSVRSYCHDLQLNVICMSSTK